MHEIFFSYSSSDRERVRLAYNGMVEHQLSVFWDQTLPPGENWDDWIRKHLERSKVAIVFWSSTSIKSQNVQDEARLSQLQQKLIPVLLDDVPDGQLPLGLGTVQCAKLADWTGDPDHSGWLGLIREVENKVMPLFAKLKVEQAERRAENINERAMKAAVIAEERLSGLLSSLQKVEQELASTRHDNDITRARFDGIEKQLARERVANEELNANLLGKIAEKDVEISGLIQTADTAVADRLKDQDKKIRTLEVANDALRQRLYVAVETRPTSDSAENTRAIFNAQLAAIERDKKDLSSDLARAESAIWATKEDARRAEENLLEKIDQLSASIIETQAELDSLQAYAWCRHPRRLQVRRLKTLHLWQSGAIIAAGAALIAVALNLVQSDSVRQYKTESCLSPSFRRNCV